MSTRQQIFFHYVRLALFFFCCSAPGALWAQESSTSKGGTTILVPETLAELQQLEKQYIAVFRKVSSSVVNVDGASGASGVIVSDDGLILTANHVVPDTEHVPITLADGRKVTARRLGRVATMDMRMLKIEGDGHWPHAELGCSSIVPPGSWCLSVGYPVHAPGGQLPLLRIGRILASSPWWVAADTLTEGGDCGGPIFDLQGRILAINIGTFQNAFRGTSHIPIDAFHDAWQCLKRGETVFTPVHAQLNLLMVCGVSPALGTDKAELGTVIPGSMFDRAGLRSGDVIVGFGEQKIDGFADLVMASHELSRGKEVKVTAQRAGTEVTVEITLNRFQHVPGWRSVSSLIDGNTWLGEHPEVERHQRNDPRIKAAFKNCVAAASGSTVTVWVNGVRRCLGTVVHADGYIATSAGDFTGEIHCQTSTGQKLPAHLVTRNDSHGFVLLKTDSDAPLTPVEWSAASPVDIGTFVAVVQPNAEPLTFGVVSAEPRPIPAEPLDGLDLSSTLQLRRIVLGSKAETLGLRDGDFVEKLNDQAIGSLHECRQFLGRLKPGASLEISVQRELEAGRRSPHKIAVSAVGLSKAFLHDAAIGSSHFGGPVVNTAGKAIGINVGETHNISVCAVPGDIVREAVASAIRGP